MHRETKDSRRESYQPDIDIIRHLDDWKGAAALQANDTVTREQPFLTAVDDALEQRRAHKVDKLISVPGSRALAQPSWRLTTGKAKGSPLSECAARCSSH